MALYPTRTPGELGSLEDRIARLESQLRRVTSPTAEQYAQAVANLNATDSTEGSTFGLGLQNVSGSGQWYEAIAMPVGVAPGKSRVDGLFIAQAAMVDTGSGGGATLSLRFVVRYPDGTTDTSVAFQAAKNAGASAVNNVVSGSYRVSRNGLPEGSSIEVAVQVAATNPAVFAPNSGNFVQGAGIFVSSNND